ncbi:hypothetical protein [Desulfosoma caldarium]|uniref:Uncharacterized protein n=1 Tax=Desulfosoma caldarium TaxID=610254 RepID=A0A3N1VN51_9BACT|nr:hypothetical protein [Desulfosoma caldarium]ROR03380.1 hypothetical protein EDC27_0116 [Desulfosoma caldarium]
MASILDMHRNPNPGHHCGGTIALGYGPEPDMKHLYCDRCRAVAWVHRATEEKMDRAQKLIQGLGLGEEADIR